MRPSVKLIQRAVADYYELEASRLAGPDRRRAIAHPRQLAMYLARTMTTCSFPDLGRRFGGRDHTTIIDGVRKVERRRAASPDVALALDAISAHVSMHAAIQRQGLG